MKQEKKRKGYTTQQQQNEANKRYLLNHPEKKEKFMISNYKSKCKRYINVYAQKEDLKEIEELIKKRRKFLKEEKKKEKL